MSLNIVFMPDRALHTTLRLEDSTLPNSAEQIAVQSHHLFNSHFHVAPRKFLMLYVFFIVTLPAFFT